MEKQFGSIVTSVLLALTFGCWLTALVAPGWFLLEIKTSSSSSSLTSALFEESPKKKITTEVDMGLFFINVCVNEKCEQIDYEKMKTMKNFHAMPELLELQAEGVLAMALCTISALLVTIPARSKSTRYLFALILMSIAVILESILIYRMASANAKMDKIKKIEHTLLAGISMEVKLPYSILIAGIGALFGILGCVSSAVMYRKSRDCAQPGQVLNVFHAAPATGFTILQETY
ncbi:uncharacterized protein LOC128163058 [Crassostrea angulata]|uniref:uncharacterized protein LOC128163058 n=1 Tax=Magallana angulata TaxID=2784310 RepID=UPI0022B09DE6|nr:uncharacterized protein LOC128163058 [Crassostrea angulata]